MNVTDLHVYAWPISPAEKDEQRRLIAEGQAKGWTVSLSADIPNRRTSLLRSAPLEHVSGPIRRVMIQSGFIHRRRKPDPQSNAA